MNLVSDTLIPENSSLHAFVSTANFSDAYVATLTYPSLTPLEILVRAASVTPEWVNNLMAIRNRIARLSGLKDVGQLNATSGAPFATHQVGDRLAIFKILEMSDKELLLGLDDRHLDVRVSIFKIFEKEPRSRYVISTAVKVHNWLGHIYMVPVRRVHPFVVRAVMRRAVV